MKTIIFMLAMMLSIVEVQPLFAQVVKSASFHIVNIPIKQGKIMLTTENGRHSGMTDATATTVKINLANIPCGKHTIYVFHDVNGNSKLDKSANGIPSEYCAVQEIELTEDNQIFKIELVDVRQEKLQSK